MNWSYWLLLMVGVVPMAFFFAWLRDKRPHWSWPRCFAVGLVPSILWAAFVSVVTR